MKINIPNVVCEMLENHLAFTWYHWQLPIFVQFCAVSEFINN